MNARAQVRLVEDVLEISRIICGKVRLELRPLDLAAIIDAALHREILAVRRLKV